MRTRYREVGEEFVPGMALPVIIDNINYHLAEMVVYKDGMIDCWGLMDLPSFEEKIRSGWLRTSIPDGSELSAFPLGGMKVEKFYARRTETDLLQEVLDIIEKLNDRPDSLARCHSAFTSYVQVPGPDSKEKLLRAYEAVPRHNRQFILSDMDVDDIPIRVVLFGPDEFTRSKKAQVQESMIRERYLKGLI
jgi:hypothetical protein